MAIARPALLEGSRVLVLDGESLVERKLKTGLSNWQFTEVIEGLSGGERVVTEGIQRIRPGLVVNATEAKPGA